MPAPALVVVLLLLERPVDHVDSLLPSTVENPSDTRTVRLSGLSGYPLTGSGLAAKTARVADRRA